MTLESWAILLIWSFLFIYSILGSIDFGSGFWAMVYFDRNNQADQIANRFLSPSWEVSNTFLVLLVVAFIGFFPLAAYMLATVLVVPVSLILLLIAIRSTFMVFSYSMAEKQKTFRLVSGITGILVPALLISALPVTEGGFVKITDNTETFLIGKWLTSPSVYMYLLFGLTSALFISSLFLADYAKESGSLSAYQVYRKNAQWLGPTALVIAIITLLATEPEAGWFIDNLIEQVHWFLLSLLAFLFCHLVLWWKEGSPRLAFLGVIAQYGFASFGYGFAHLPYIVYPYLTVSEGFTGESAFYALLWVYGIGLAILLPGFYLFWRLFLKDRRYVRRNK